MKMNYQYKSKAYTEALKLNAINLEEVINWADQIILAEGEPNVEFIYLSLSKNASEAITNLNRLSVGADEERSYRFLFGLLYTALTNGLTSYHMVAKRLYFWVMYETNLSGYGELSCYWGDLDLADAGSHGDPDEVREKMLKYLNEKSLGC